MQYAKYLGNIVKQQGFPNLSQNALQSYFTVIFIEGQMESYKKIQLKLDEKDKFKFQMEIFKLNKSLASITGNLKPKDFLEIMMAGD
jgi:hypothetical protein